MYYAVKSFGASMLMPVTVFLTLSFFVMLAVKKIEAGSLKTFGKVVVVLLWLCAATILLTGLYSPRGGHFMGKMMKGGMKCPMMQQGQMPMQKMQSPMPMQMKGQKMPDKKMQGKMMAQ
ncbi:MAG: hypothetical protein PHG69_03375 [Candidatus Omnitrophica bacterium]|nr:hypothetical protein [Candidatus Omnitrophota bacterium]